MKLIPDSWMPRAAAGAVHHAKHAESNARTMASCLATAGDSDTFALREDVSHFAMWVVRSNAHYLAAAMHLVRWLNEDGARIAEGVRS